MPKSILIVIQGFLGAGKTTYSKRLAAQTGVVRLNGDEYCSTNFSKEVLEADWDKCFSEAITNLYRQAEELLQSGQSVILDFGFWDRKSRDYAREVASRVGADFSHIYLNTPDELILNRLTKRSGGIARKNLENYSSLKSLFEPPHVDELAEVVTPAEARDVSADEDKTCRSTIQNFR